MNTNSSGKSYPSLGEAIAAVNKRTTEVTKISRAWGYTLIDWKGKKRRQLFESRRLAEWRLTEVRLCMIADILHLDILEILVWIHDAQMRAFNDPFECEEAGDWTRFISENLNRFDPEEHPLFESNYYLRKHERLRSIFIDSEETTKRLNTLSKLREHAISIAEERVSEIRLGVDGKWSYDLMQIDGRILTYSYESELCAHNQRVIRCLEIAADILRLDIRKRLEDFEHILMNGYYFPDETPHLGTWWKWLPHRGEVPSLPGNRNYFDLTYF